MESGITLAVLAGANAPHTAPLATDEAENAERRDMTAPPWAGVEQVDNSTQHAVIRHQPDPGPQSTFPAATRGRSKARRGK
jgi:hypothetical protein